MGLRRFLISLMAVCIAAAGATVAVADSDSTSPTDAIPVESAQLRSLAEDVQILRDSDLTEAHVTDDDLAHTPVLPDDDVIDVADARKLASEPDLLVAPTTDGTGLCVTGDGRMACGSATTIEEEGAAPAITWNVDGVHVFGIANDDIVSLTVVYDDGTTATIRPVDNVFDAELPRKPTEIRWNGPEGREALTVPAG